MGLKKLIKWIKQEDPSVKSTAEILLYQGFWAIVYHRIAHLLYKKKLYFLARFVSQVSRTVTQIEIHPGAQIAHEVFIDHGAGVVIGETAIVGNKVTIFHGVTLGGTGKIVGKRHPTVGDHVTIGAGAIILGDITIGDGAKIGANTVVVKNVPAYATIVGEVGRDISVEASSRTCIKQLSHRVKQLEQEKISITTSKD